MLGRLSKSAAAGAVCAVLAAMTMACGELAHVGNSETDVIDDAGPDVVDPPRRDAGPPSTDAGPPHVVDASVPDAKPPIAVDAGTCILHTFYRDADGDGFGDDAITLAACDPGPGWSLVGGDCYDANANAHPGAGTGWTFDRGDGSFDYDCDGLQTVEHVEVDPGYCLCSDFGCSQSTGWTANDVPPCGYTSKWNTGGDGNTCTPDIIEARQSCH